MSVTSFIFFVFFALSLIPYYIVPKNYQWILLLIYSIVFFSFSVHPFAGIYLIISIISVYICARAIASAMASGKKTEARIYLALCLLVNVGILAVLKYSNFAIENVNIIRRILHIEGSIPLMSFAAPLGLSFYTLQAVGYLLDVYWGTVRAEVSLLRTALFIGYYPQLTSGPIARFAQMEGELFVGHNFDWQQLCFGLQRMLWGLFKKLVISERLAVFVNCIYQDPVTYDGFFIWFAAASFMLQLYSDFSGCMDIIMGASQCYGVKLPENFRTPFFSRSVQEYWQRWHITMGAWLKDYVLYAFLRTRLCQNITKKIRKHWGKKASRQIPAYMGMALVWFLIGLWHGGGWRYIVGSGLWYFVLIVSAQLMEPVFKKITAALKINTECTSYHVFQSIRVFCLVCIGNMFFRLASIRDVFFVMKKGLTHWNPEILFDGALYDVGWNAKDARMALLAIAVMIFVSHLQEKGSVREMLARQNLVFRWMVFLCLIISLLLFGLYGPGYNAASFIYEVF